MTTRKKCFFLLFVYFIGCFPPKSPDPQLLRISFYGSPVTADPRASGDLLSSSLLLLLNEGLMRCVSDGDFELALASSIDLSEDQLTYIFHLRPSFWSDGTPLTAYDFERSWKKVLDPTFPAVCPYLFYSIKNGELAHKGQISSQEIGVKALDELTLQVILERPTPYFLSLTAFPCFFPIPSHAENQFDCWEKGLISNGPFCLHKANLRSEFVLIKNERFWNASQIQLQGIHIAIIESEQTALQMFKSGALDLIGGVTSPLPLDALEDLYKKEQIKSCAIPATTFCSFHTQHPLLKNKRLRKALSLAIPRDAIVQHITQMGEIPATRCIPPLLMKTPKIFYPSFDPKGAQEELEEAIKELDLRQIPPLVLSYSNSELHRKIATLLQDYWKKVLNLQIELEPCEKQSFRERLYRNDYQIALHFWIAQFHDPMNILERFQDPTNLKNLPCWENEEYNHLIQQANLERNPLIRLQILEKAEHLFCEEMPLAPIYHWSSSWIEHTKISNCNSANGFILFERISLSRKIYEKTKTENKR